MSKLDDSINSPYSTAESKKPNYVVIPPKESIMGKGYVEWIQDWSNWFYQPYPERNNDGNVVFLRSMPLAEGNYPNEPLVMIGNESLEISAEQLVLVPIITATYIADAFESPELLYGMARADISNGDNPPDLENVRINGNKIDIQIDGKSHTNFDLFEFETPVYSINIPDSSAGPSLKDQVERPLSNSGYLPAVSRGYFVILMLEAGQNYYIECRATGAATPRGPYHVSFLYHIIVNESKAKSGARTPPTRLRKNMAIKARDKRNKGQLTRTEFMEIMHILGIEGDDEDSINDIIDNMKGLGKDMKGLGKDLKEASERLGIGKK